MDIHAEWRNGAEYSTIERGGVDLKWSLASVVVSGRECGRWQSGDDPPLTLEFFVSAVGCEFGAIEDIAQGGSDNSE